MSLSKKKIEEVREEKKKLRKSARLHLGHWIVLASSIFLTLMAWYFTKVQVDEKARSEFERQAKQVIELISERMVKYEDALWSGVAAIKAAGGNVSNEQWENFSKHLKIEQKYPGINGIGLIEYVPTKEKLGQHLSKHKKERPDYRVHPPHIRTEFLPITYIEPVASNRAAVGLDIAHENNRYSAAIKARDTGVAQITGPITLVQDAGKTPGFLFYVPFYRDSNIKTLEGRKKSFAGLVYAPFIVKKLMEGTLDRENRQVGVKISDGSTELYNEFTVADKDYDTSPLFKKNITIDAYGRTFIFEIHSGLSFRNATSSNQPIIILVAGIIIECLILALFVLLAKANRQAIQLSEKVTNDYESQLEELETAMHKVEEANHLKSSFLATMSHEIRTPLNGIMGMGQLLKREASGDYQKKLTQSIITSGELLLSIIESILDISRIEAGLVTPENTEFNVTNLCQGIVSGFEKFGKEKNVTIETDVRLPCENFISDPNIIKQVLVTLIDNAIKFTENGTVRLVVTEKGGDQLSFSVADSGIGIEKKDWEMIFERFRQVDDQNTRKFGGTGLGLSIAKDFVELLHGTITVNSVPDLGSTFTFIIPVSTVSAEYNQAEKEDTTQQENKSEVSEVNGHYKILLAEDNIINQEVITQAFQGRENYTIEMVNDGVEALEKLEEESFDLILMDIQMPRMTGDVAIRKIRASGKSYDSIPIIVLTANAMRGAEELYLMDGANSYITKPIDIDELMEKIVSQLHKEEEVESVA